MSMSKAGRKRVSEAQRERWARNGSNGTILVSMTTGEALAISTLISKAVCEMVPKVATDEEVDRTQELMRLRVKVLKKVSEQASP